jgi:hypothetical protein
MLEKLKNNRVQWRLLEPAEREYFERVGRGNCQIYNLDGWEDCMGVNEFKDNFVYRIKADYTPEIKWRVIIDSTIYVRVNSRIMTLASVINHPDFKAYEYADGSRSGIPRTPNGEIPEFVVFKGDSNDED